MTVAIVQPDHEPEHGGGIEAQLAALQQLVASQAEEIAGLHARAEEHAQAVGRLDAMQEQLDGKADAIHDHPEKVDEEEFDRLQDDIMADFEAMFPEPAEEPETELEPPPPSDDEGEVEKAPNPWW